MVAVLVLGAGAWFAREAWQDRRRCDIFATLTAAFGTESIGTGPNQIRVIGDSYTEGMELDAPRDSWVAAYAEAADATVEADGASATGFTNPGPCGRGDFVSRAVGEGPLIVQGGLNDVHETEAAIRDAACAVIAEGGGNVAIVGPPAAPARDDSDLQKVDTALARAAAECGARYVSTRGWDLEYVDDLHLTPESHASFGESVAQQLATWSTL